MEAASTTGCRPATAPWLLLLLAGCLAFPPVSIAAGRPTRIGVLFPLSGSAGADAAPLVDAVALASAFVREAAPGLSVEYVVRDAGPGADGAVAAARRLADSEGVTSFIGPAAQEAVSRVLREVAIPEGLMLALPGPGGPDPAVPAEMAAVFSISPPPSREGEALAELALRRGLRGVAVLHADEPGALALALAFQAALEHRGGSVTGREALAGDSPSARGPLGRLLGDSPGGILVLAGRERRRLAEQAAGLAPGVPLLLQGPPPAGPAPLQGSCGAYAVAPDSPAHKLFTERWREATGGAIPSPAAARVLDLAVLLALASAAPSSGEGSDTPAAVAAPPGEAVDLVSLSRAFTLVSAGKEIDYQGVSGPVDGAGAGPDRGTWSLWCVEEGIPRELWRVRPGALPALP